MVCCTKNNSVQRNRVMRGERITSLLTLRQDRPEAVSVVTVIRGVVVAARRPAADGVVVPTTAAKHTVRA